MWQVVRHHIPTAWSSVPARAQESRLSSELSLLLTVIVSCINISVPRSPVSRRGIVYFYLVRCFERPLFFYIIQ